MSTIEHTITKVGKREENERGYAQLVLDTADDGSTAYYRVSAIRSAFDTGRAETLVFPATPEGNVADWMDVVGIDGMDIGRAMSELKAVLEGRAEYDTFDTPAMRAAGGDPLTFMLNTLKGLARKIEDEP